ncbi:MAG TPA: PD-(D/E)XK nuclease family protein [Bacteroidales bacterium]|nr:PD-(D/E)XK nuclease family protein [Bacteroidales bacterium]
MENKFLYSVARHFYKKQENRINKLCFVFPNRRSSIFFKKYLTQCMAGEALFAPKMITINDFFLELSGGQLVDKIEALYILYQQYAKVFSDEEGIAKSTFDEFVYWGDVFLNDFDDIDKYLVDAEKLFTNIGDLQKLTAEENDYMSDGQKRAIKEFYTSWNHSKKRDMVSKKKEEDNGEKEESGDDAENEEQKENGERENNEINKGNGERDKIDIKEEFSTIWENLHRLYTSFREALKDKGLMYEGMIYREVAEALKEEIKEPQEKERKEEILKKCRKYDKIIFVGLNALNECEKSLFRHLNKPGSGIDVDFIWDYYGDILTDEANKSSQFMRRGDKGNVVEFPQKESIEPYGTPKNPTHNATFGPGKIEIIGIPSAAGQTRYVTEILEGIHCNKDGTLLPNLDLEETAIVLPDESLLHPMLNSIPKCVDKVNVTMGYPLINSHTATFVSQLEELHKKTRPNKSGGVSFHHKSVMALLSHPFLTSLLPAEGLKSIKNEIIGRNLVYVNLETLVEEQLERDDNQVDTNEQPFKGDKQQPYFGNQPIEAGEQQLSKSELFKAIFSTTPDPENVGNWLEKILQLIQENLDGIDREAAYHYLRVIKRISDLNLPLTDIKTYFRLLKQIVSVLSVPYRGEPLQGIQIMGPLETRALDFKNVIILSNNEGIFPSANVSNSFIPYNLRLGFGLPTYEYQDSISAYHFYRSICRAEHIWLIYDSRTEGTKVGEPSRYIHQLKYGYNIPRDGRRRLDIKQLAISYEMKGRKVNSLDVEKSPAIMKKLREKYIMRPDGDFNGSFSASTLNDYFKCQRLFYLKHVEGIGEEDEVVEEVDGAQFGTIFHYVMEKLYLPDEKFCGVKWNKSQIEGLKKDKTKIEKLILEGFAKAREKRGYSYANNTVSYDDLSGQERIVFELIADFVKKTLEIDEEYAPFTFKDAEMKINYQMDIDNIGTVKIKGSIDRVDEKSGTIRIIDYKTGSVSGKMRDEKGAKPNDTIPKLFKEEKNGSCVKNSVSFQLLLYKMLYLHQPDLGNGDNILPAVIALRHFHENKGVRSQEGLTKEIMDEFEEKVKEKIKEIFNEEVPFKAITFDDGEYGACRYCNYQNICKIL